jgi:hypothetical protein
MNRKKVISMAGMAELFVMNLANTVAVAKQNSANSRNKTPLCILEHKNTKEQIFQEND